MSMIGDLRAPHGCSPVQGESLKESIHRHEHLLALKLGLKAGDKVRSLVSLLPAVRLSATLVATSNSPADRSRAPGPRRGMRGWWPGAHNICVQRRVDRRAQQQRVPGVKWVSPRGPIAQRSSAAGTVQSQRPWSLVAAGGAHMSRRALRNSEWRNLKCHSTPRPPRSISILAPRDAD